MKELRILIVDDCPIIRYGLRKLIEAQTGWKICSEAATGHAALRKVEKFKPEIILLDLSLPDIRGIDAVPKIIEIHAGAAILVLSDYESGLVVRRAAASGARGLVFKTDGLRDLVRAVRALAHGTFYRSDRASELINYPMPVGVASGYQSALTARELQILKLLAEGKTNKETAAVLSVSVRTVEAHRASLMRKLDLTSLSDLIYFAIRNGIVHL